jgi:hypothetical protein
MSAIPAFPESIEVSGIINLTKKGPSVEMNSLP